MKIIEDILNSKIKPKEKQMKLVDLIVSGEIQIDEFISFFKSAKDTAKGTCADVLKNVSAQNPELLEPYIDTLLNYINYPLPRVKWGIPETIGNMASHYPNKVTKAVPLLLKNTTDDKKNTTVIKWCAAFALTEIAKNNTKTQKELLPIFKNIIKTEQNNGVRNVYIKAMKTIGKDK